jgi:outer membrane protein TolC
MAWAKLSARFVVGGTLNPTPLPEPVALSRDVAWWKDTMFAVSDQLAAANAQLAMAEAGAARASADRIPDPTLGIYTASEAYGDENIVGGTVSIPFPGERRSLELQRRLAQVNAARDRIDATTREIEGTARAAYAAAYGHYHRWKIAGTAATAMRENAVIAQKAYTLGEQDLQTLLLARRQALNSAEAEQQARASALRAHYALLIETKLLWGGTSSDATLAESEAATHAPDDKHD